jgi:hypothetical protein
VEYFRRSSIWKSKLPSLPSEKGSAATYFKDLFIRGPNRIAIPVKINAVMKASGRAGLFYLPALERRIGNTIILPGLLFEGGKDAEIPWK